MEKMSHNLLSPNMNDKPAVLMPTITGGEIDYVNDGYQLETDAEKPVLLELGTSNKMSESTSAYNSGFSLDINHNNPYLMQPQNYSHQPISPLSHSSLYNNPYSNRCLSLPSTTSIIPISRSNDNLNSSDYPSHIPQTVYTWPLPDLQTKSVHGSLRRAMSDIVPPAMSINYDEAREHIISVERNPSWKEKALQMEKDYKKTACDRERTRMRDMNRAFDLLRSKLPIHKANGKKYSKIESLRIAINYINHLQDLLNENPLPQNMGSGAQDRHENAVDYVLGLQSHHDKMMHYDNQNLI